MPYISQECMKDFLVSIKTNHMIKESTINEIKSAMGYYFGYSEEK